MITTTTAAAAMATTLAGGGVLSYNPAGPWLTNKDKPILYHNGYGYIKDTVLKHNNEPVCYYMKCRVCGSSRVKVVGTIESPTEIEVMCHIHTKPTCEYDIIRYTNDKALSQLKQIFKSDYQFENTYDRFVQSLRNPALTGREYVEQHGYAHFMTRQELHSSISRWKNARLPPQPKNVNELTNERIPQFLKYALHTDEGIDPPLFLFHFSKVPLASLDLEGTGDGVIMMFATPQFFQEMANQQHIFVDGTFDVVPNIIHNARSSSQLFSIHGFHAERLIPYAYILLPGKSKRTYVTMLRALLEHGNSHQPSPITLRWNSVMMDFQEALRNAFADVFPNLQQRGCFFHYCQSLYRHVSKESVLRYLYHDNENHYGFRLLCRMLQALAFLPPQRVREGFHMLKTNYQTAHPNLWSRCSKVAAYLNYFERQWLGLDETNNTLIESWNVCNAPPDRHRTNNALEGWHSSFAKKLHKHTGIWDFIQRLQAYHGSVEVELESIRAGRAVNRIRRKTISIQQRIDRLTEQFSSNSINMRDFLFGITNTLHQGNVPMHSGSTPAGFPIAENVNIPHNPRPTTTAAAAAASTTPSTTATVTASATTLATEPAAATAITASTTVSVTATAYSTSASAIVVTSQNDTGVVIDLSGESLTDISAATPQPLQQAMPTVVGQTTPTNTDENATLVNQVRQKVADFKAAKSSAIQHRGIIWPRSRVNIDNGDDLLIDQVMNACAALSEDTMLDCPSVAHDVAIDIAGVFRTLTRKVALALVDSEMVDVDEVSNKRPYFIGNVGIGIPNTDPIIQNRFNFFYGLGRYLLLMLLHEGELPNCLHKSVVKYMLNIPDDQSFTKNDVVDLGIPGWDHLFDKENELSNDDLTIYCDAIVVISGNEAFSIERMTEEQRNNPSTSLVYNIREAFFRCYLRDGVKESLDALRAGFNLFPELSFSFSEYMACNSLKIRDISDFYSLVDSSELEREDQRLFGYFRYAIERMSAEELNLLVVFTTGCLRLPVKFEFRIFNLHEATTLPIAHTCFKRLDMYTYRYETGVHRFDDNNNVVHESGGELMLRDLRTVIHQSGYQIA